MKISIDIMKTTCNGFQECVGRNGELVETVRNYNIIKVLPLKS